MLRFDGDPAVTWGVALAAPGPDGAPTYVDVQVVAGVATTPATEGDAWLVVAAVGAHAADDVERTYVVDVALPEDPAPTGATAGTGTTGTTGDTGTSAPTVPRGLDDPTDAERPAGASSAEAAGCGCRGAAAPTPGWLTRRRPPR